jgi:drug/metabolite transporter (DMT)-like permease
LPAEASDPAPSSPTAALTAALTAAAMLAFAANSLLCRAALAARHADAASFTTLRLVGGAAALSLLAWARGPRRTATPSAWASAVILFAYAILFSLAYLRIPAGTGALLLFAAVQLTMIGAGLRAGERPRVLEWAGLGVSLVGLVLLTRPGLAQPDTAGAAAMLAAGVAWGLYSLRGRGAADPVAANAAAFARAIPLALAASAGFALVAETRITLPGLALALASGALTSGLGYAIWYAALRGLSAMRAAIVQLSVPPLAAALAVLTLGESVSLRLVLASVLILGGIALAAAAAHGHDNRFARNARTNQ